MTPKKILRPNKSVSRVLKTQLSKINWTIKSISSGLVTRRLYFLKNYDTKWPKFPPCRNWPICIFSYMQFIRFNNVRSRNKSNIPEVMQYAHVLLFLDLAWQKGGITRVIGGSEEMGNAITRLADFCTDSVCFLRFLCKLKNSATSADFNLPHLALPLTLIPWK